MHYQYLPVYLLYNQGDVCIDRVHQEGHGWPSNEIRTCFHLADSLFCSKPLRRSSNHSSSSCNPTPPWRTSSSVHAAGDIAQNQTRRSWWFLLYTRLTFDLFFLFSWMTAIWLGLYSVVALISLQALGEHELLFLQDVAHNFSQSLERRAPRLYFR